MSPLRSKDERTADQAYSDAGATIEALRREISSLHRENQELRAQNAELRTAAGVLNGELPPFK